jgi:hypothetical protein
MQSALGGLLFLMITRHLVYIVVIESDTPTHAHHELVLSSAEDTRRSAGRSERAGVSLVIKKWETAYRRDFWGEVTLCGCAFQFLRVKECVFALQSGPAREHTDPRKKSHSRNRPPIFNFLNVFRYRLCIYSAPKVARSILPDIPRPA